MLQDYAPHIAFPEMEAARRPFSLEGKSPKEFIEAWIKDYLCAWFHSGFEAVETNLMQEVLQI